MAIGNRKNESLFPNSYCLQKKMWYNIDFNKLVGLLLPTSLRKRKMLFWLQVLVTPLKRIHYDFLQKRNEKNGDLYRLKHNGQVCYLRKALNDNFDPEKRRIQITDGNQFRRKYLYTKGEKKPVFLGKLFLRERSDYVDTGVDFLVLLPKNLTYNPHEMNALIDFYKLAGKRYKIIGQ